MNQNPPWTRWTHLIIFIFLARRAFSATNPHFLACRNDPSGCGNDGPIVKFPFFIRQLQQAFCGHPGFELHCNENLQTVLKLPGNDDYIVHEIFYENQTLRISNRAFSDSSSFCDVPIHNLTLLSEYYQLGPGTANSILLLNCSDSLPPHVLKHKTGCGSDGDGESGLVLAFCGNDSEWVGVSGKCGGRVVAPVGGGGGGVTMVERLGDGFVLKWTASDCSECEGSGGECGFDSDSFKFQCYCPDRAQAKHCVPGNGNLGMKLGLGLGLGIGWPLIVAVCLLFYIRRHRNKQKCASSEYTRKSSSDPSSAADLELEEGTIHKGVHIFLYSELEEATNHFQESNEIGDGGFGAVYYGKLKDGREVAVKRLYEHNYRRLEQFINEIKILTRLRHKNLVSLYGCTSRRSRELLLVYEFIPNGTLAHHLHGEGSKTGSSMTWPIRMNIAIETASALAYLHASDTIHRDVKTDNILLDNNFSVKVADFGLSRLFPIDVTHVSTAPQGTPGYVDPEYHQCYQLTDKSDVYSFGVVLIELISSMPAVDISRHRHDINLANLAVNRIQGGAFNDLVDPNLGFNSDMSTRTMIMLVAELAFRCLQQDKEMRPDMEEVLENLKMIQNGGGGNNKNRTSQDSGIVRVLCIEPSEGDSGVLKTDMPPRSPDCCDEVGLLKNMQRVTSQGYSEVGLMLKSMRPPHSPNAVTDRWLSSSTTGTNPSM